MKHKLAYQTKTIDEYLLDELSEENRQAFEEHMFDCPECAAKVREELAMIEDLKQVFGETAPAAVKSFQTARGWREWFRPMTLVPACAALLLVSVVGYQNVVVIPALSEARVFDAPNAFVADSQRGPSPPVVYLKPGAAFIDARFVVSSPKVFAGYVCEFHTDSNGSTYTLPCGNHPHADFNLDISLPAAKFPAGGYTMILRSASDQQIEISRYSFVVKKEDH